MIKRRCSLACLIILGSALVTAGPALGATFAVTSAADSGPGTLRQAIAAANTAGGDNQITFSLPAGTTIGLSGSALAVNDPTGRVTITGPGANQLAISRASGSPGPLFSAFSAVTVSGLTFSGGTGGSFFSAALVLSGSAPGVDILDGLGVSGNTADAGGSGAGGALVDATRATIRNSTFSNNSVTNAGGSGSGGAVVGGGERIENTTFSANQVVGTGAAFDAGAIGGFVNPGGTLVNATVVANSSSAGTGGIGAAGIGVADTILARNVGAAAPDCLPGTVSRGYNLVGNATGCSFMPATGDLVGTAAGPLNPVLGPLADNGGPTPTMLPLAGSPVINAANPAAPSSAAPPAAPALIPCLTADQRNVVRPQGIACDIGAVELALPVAGTPPTISGTPSVGQLLTCTPGTFSPAATAYVFSWTLNGSVVAGATTATYTPTAAGTVTCSVAGTNGAGTGPAASSVPVMVAAAPVPGPTPGPASCPRPGFPTATVAADGTVTAVFNFPCAGRLQLEETAPSGLGHGVIAVRLAPGHGRFVFSTGVLTATKSSAGQRSFTLRPGAAGRALLRRRRRLPIRLYAVFTATGSGPVKLGGQLLLRGGPTGARVATTASPAWARALRAAELAASRRGR